MARMIKLKVIQPPKDGDKVIFKTNDKDALVKGIELESYVCGNCEFVLAENVIPLNYHGIIMQCPSCKAYNDLP